MQVENVFCGLSFIWFIQWGDLHPDVIPLKYFTLKMLKRQKCLL